MIRAASPGVRRWLPALAFGFACGAQADPGDPLGWLKRAAEAARVASYTGTFVHTNGDRTSTVRITHVNAGGDEHERIEPLDGATHEFVRRNDELLCHFPDAKTVRLDPRVTARFFPALLGAGSAETLARSYDVKLGSTERVLGYDCRWIRLEPRDELRYAQRLCSELATGLLLRAKTFNAAGQVIEQYTFTDLKLGPQASRADLKSLFRARSRQWISDGQPRDEAASAESGWGLATALPGFEKVAELRRKLPGRAEPVAQIVYTDGLASLSVFVEPNGSPPRTAEAASEDGTTAFYVRPAGEHVVTVLGEVPLATAREAGRSVARLP